MEAFESPADGSATEIRALGAGPPSAAPEPAASDSAATVAPIAAQDSDSAKTESLIVPSDDKTVISTRPLPLPATASAAPPHLVGTPAEIGPSLIGKRLEHYELLEFVGGGGMGAVFRGRDTRLGREVAVKVLLRDQASEETIRRFRNEAQSAARLDHRNIARVHYVGDDGGWNFIVFEYIEGKNLREVVAENGPLSIADALNYTRQVALALEHASSRDVVHRDIKPSNVLLTPGGMIKLVDMGLARLHQVESGFEDLTASDVTLGTFDYISPEQARDPRVADVRSDIYSLGCTLYFMLSGAPPFPDGNALQKMLRHSGEEPPDVRLFRPELSPAVLGLLAKMLAKRPVQRQQSAEQLIQEIERAAAAVGVKLASTPTEARPRVPQTANPWRDAAPIALPAAVLIAATIAVGYFNRPDSQAAAPLTLRAGLPAEMERPTVPPPEIVPSATQGQAPPSGLVRDPPAAATIAPPPSNIASAVIGDATATPSFDRLVSPTGPAINSRASEAAAGSPPAAPLIVGEPPDSLAVRMAAAASLAPAPGAPAPQPVSPPEVAPPSKPAGARIYVHPHPEEVALSAGSEAVPTLALAVQRAAKLGLTEIELDFDGPLSEIPFDVTAPRLTIKPAPRRKPVILFQPTDAAEPEQRRMIRMLGGPSARLQIQGMEFRFLLPDEPSFGWSLASVYQGQQLDFSDCCFTIRDQTSAGLPVHDLVSLVVANPRRAADAMKMDDELAMAVKLQVMLNRCVVRGDTLLLSLPEEIPLQLTWVDGLFASPRRLIETGGCLNRPRWHERLELTLARVSVYARQGVFQAKRRADAAHHLELDVQSDDSIYAADPDVPLFEFVDLQSVDDFKSRFTGANNGYLREETIFLRLRSQSAVTPPRDTPLADAGEFSGGRSPDVVVWRNLPSADSPASEWTRANFQLPEFSSSSAGFDAAVLPEPSKPLAPALPPAAVTPAAPPPE